MYSKSFFILSFIVCNISGLMAKEYQLGLQPSIVLSTTHPSSQNILAWNAHSMVYYTTGLQDSQTIIDIYDAEGQLQKSQNFSFPIKGIWYNETLDFLEAYNPETNSCFSFFVDEEGFFENEDTLHRLADVKESVDASYTLYNPAKDVYAYIEPVTGMIIEVTAYSGEIENYIELKLPVDKKHIDTQYLFYTAVGEHPYALINKSDKVLYFINEEGEVSHSLNWQHLEVQPESFGFANGMFWVYESDQNTWKGFSLN